MQYTILILDDDARYRKLITSLLTFRGYRVIEAATAREATTLIEQYCPQLAIVDYRLPDVDGLAWITWLRGSGRHIPVVFLSGFRCESTMMFALRVKLQVSAVLLKPIKPIPFVTLIDNVLKASVKHLSEHAYVAGHGFAASQSEDTVDSFVTSIKKTKTSGIFRKDTIVPRVLGAARVETASGLPAASQSMRTAIEDDDCLSVLQSLRDEFAQELPDRLTRLQKLVPLAASGSPEALHEIIRDCHRLRGTAASFGLPLLGDSMGDIEDSLVGCGQDMLDDPCTWRTVDVTLNKALAAIAQNNRSIPVNIIANNEQSYCDNKIESTDVPVTDLSYPRRGCA